MKQNYIELVLIFDRSGSMNSIWTDAVGGFNSFIEQQRKNLKDKQVKFTLAMFDDQYLLPYEGIDLHSQSQINIDNYQPRGWTALYDAIGLTTNAVGQRLRNMQQQDRPQKVIVAIMTDGQENASKQFRIEQIKQMIETQQNDYNWSFIFLSSDLESFNASINYGINANSRVYYSQDSSGYTGTFSVYNQLSKTIGNIVIGKDQQK